MGGGSVKSWRGIKTVFEVAIGRLCRSQLPDYTRGYIPRWRLMYDVWFVVFLTHKCYSQKFGIESSSLYVSREGLLNQAVVQSHATHIQRSASESGHCHNSGVHRSIGMTPPAKLASEPNISRTSAAPRPPGRRSWGRLRIVTDAPEVPSTVMRPRSVGPSYRYAQLIRPM